jgi:hypothetical protein
VHDVAGGGKVVRAAVDGVGETIFDVSGALAEDGVGDGAVVVVDDADGSAGGRGRDVGGGGDDSVAVGLDVAAVDVFGEAAARRCSQGDAGGMLVQTPKAAATKALA